MLQETFSMKSLCLPSQHCCPWNQTKALRKCEIENINIKIEQIQHKRFLPGLSLHLELDNKMQRPVPAQTQQRPGHRQLGLKNATQLGRCVQAARQPGSSTFGPDNYHNVSRKWVEEEVCTNKYQRSDIIGLIFRLELTQIAHIFPAFNKYT